MSKYTRHQSVVSRQSDEPYSDNHWYQQFQDKLQKTSVQPRGQGLFDEIASIMHNSTPKYPSVQAAVDDMMQRSGLTAYLDMSKTSQDHEVSKPAAKKTAQAGPSQDPKMPNVIQAVPSILHTLQNIIQDSKGNLPVPAIISRLRSMHARDIAEESDWEDEKLIRLVSRLNLQAKTDNPSNYDNYDNLGKKDYMANSDIDASNTDAFNILMPAKI
jgi:hypothetical protein